jgi:ubiquinone/menaquinone biosynthesis C-methylase UbiE/uncharacterized protein YbaR (Trm112 family)
MSEAYGTSSFDGALPEAYASNLSILICPACDGDLELEGASLRCARCGHAFASEKGIPLLFWPNEGTSPDTDVTEVVRAFYEETPFPNYDEVESSYTLRQKARRGVFAQGLDDSLPWTAKVLEVGCGTGQLSNFLGECSTRTVFGADLCLNSLKLAQRFKQANRLERVGFLQANLFRLPLRSDSFDFVVSNGVLHHTSDPRSGFKSMARVLKPGGFILVGLYNAFGRLPTDFRRLMIRYFGECAELLDSRLRKTNLNADRRRAWLRDQYKHPHESKHTYGEVLEWFDESGFEFVASIPGSFGGGSMETNRLFEPQPRPSRLARFLIQSEMLLKGSADGGLFIMFGRKLGS